MVFLGLIKEGKIPADNRVALTPSQCKWIHKKFPDVKIVVEPSEHRCFADMEYIKAGIEMRTDLTNCDFLLGIKEVPVEQLLPNKTYLFFSHTKKKQVYNQELFRTILRKKITLIDYECLEHEDGQRILGFGFFAGIVGAHNGIMAYGRRTGTYELERVNSQKSFRQLIHHYFGLKLPNIKIAITGSGRVAHGVLEIMNLLGVIEMEPDEFLARKFTYPVFTHLKGADLYSHHVDHGYERQQFHNSPQEFDCKFQPYTKQADILMNGIYWDHHMPRLFTWEQMQETGFSIQTIADITDDQGGSVPCNLGDSPVEDPVYGVDKMSRLKTAAYLPSSVDMVAIGNLPNELPRDASRYFGEQLIKYVLEELIQGQSPVIEKATMVKKGTLSVSFSYLREYAGL